MTEWSELKALPTDTVRTAMRTPLIVDGRNLLDPEAARAAGFVYEGIGRPPLLAMSELEAVLEQAVGV